jgi:glutamine amidotransferase
LPHISVINYGVGNLRSVKKGLEKSGAKVKITNSSKELNKTDAIVFPGVGAFKAAMKNLSPLLNTLKQFVEDEKPILGICLGLQLFFTKSSEGGSMDGLNFISGNVIKLPDTVKTPQMGWNTINITKFHPLLEDIENESYVYFVHSYFAKPSNSEVVIATTKYGCTFPSVIVKKNLFATQFHPEKSSKVGLKIIENFVNIVGR